jgi:hypothetical protein
MVSKAGLRQEERERRSRIKNGISAVGAIVIGLCLFPLPRTGIYIALDLSFALLISLYCVWHCWGLSPTWFKRIAFMLLHVAIVTGIGYAVWPRITVSPPRFSFRGYPNETVNFSVRNERGDDVYDVQIPFLIGYNKHLDAKLSAKVMPSNEPSQPLHDDYTYCYGKKGNVQKVLPNEQEVLVVRIEHQPPSGIGTFTITYAGGEGFATKPGAPSFVSEPYSYSPTQGTVGVRGDYRICKFVMSKVGQ